MTDATLAQIAYHAYGQSTDFKNFQGNPMPEWEALPEAIQQAWEAAANAVGAALAQQQAEAIVTISRAESVPPAPSTDELQVLLGDTGLAIAGFIRAEVTRQINAAVDQVTDLIENS